MKPSVTNRGGTSTISLSSISNSPTGSPHQRLLHSLPNSSLLLQSSIRTSSSISTAKRVNRTAAACFGYGNAIGKESPAKKLRGLLESPGIHLGPACFDALSAKLIERSGFDFCFSTGFGISASRLGLPDTGFISYGEVVDQGRQITQSVPIPIIGDGDNGYGNAMNVKRTVKGYISAGFAGIILEDQVSPKACGHTQGRKVVSREEAVMKIKAAVDARRESGSDIVIVARTDSRQAVSFEESIWRSQALADAGADVLFIDALASKEEMKAFCEVYPPVPKMANMLEGGGKTPILNPIELEDLGYKIVAYPLSLLGVSIRAMQDALTAIKGGRIPPAGSMPSFEELKEILGFNTYYEEEKRYATITSQLSSKRASSNAYSIQQEAEEDTEQRDENPRDPVIEVITPDVYNKYGADGPRDPFSGIWSRTLRVKITGQDGFERLDVRIPCLQNRGKTIIFPLYAKNVHKWYKQHFQQKRLKIFNSPGGNLMPRVEEAKIPKKFTLPLHGFCSLVLTTSGTYTIGQIRKVDFFFGLDWSWRIPSTVWKDTAQAGFLEGITNVVPALGGVNLKALLDDASLEVGGKLLLDFIDAAGDRIQVFLE